MSVVTTVKRLVGNSPGVREAYRAWRDARVRRMPAPMTPWGFTLAGHPAAAAGAFEREETTLVRDLLADVDLLVNVGANVGYYCCHALSLGRAVIACEPMPSNLRYLLANLHANGWSAGVEVHPVAAGAEAGIVPMWGSGTGASTLAGWAGAAADDVMLVPTLPLDRIVGPSLNGRRALVVVDVEGAEWSMLAGAAQTAAASPRPIWLMEITWQEHQPAGVLNNPHFADTFDWFFSRGYQASTADAERRPITVEDVSAFVAGERPVPAHNFLFW